MKFRTLSLMCTAFLGITACGKSGDQESNRPTPNDSLKVELGDLGAPAEPVDTMKSTAYDTHCYGKWNVESEMGKEAGLSSMLDKPTKGESLSITFPNKVTFKRFKDGTATPVDLIPVKYECKDYKGMKNAILVCRFPDEGNHHLVFMISWFTEEWEFPDDRNKLYSVLGYDIENYEDLKSIESFDRILMFYTMESPKL